MTNNELLDLYYDIKYAKPERVAALKSTWKYHTGCDYPRAKNHKGKENDFLKIYKPNEPKKTNGLDDLILSKTNESKLISNTLYSHENSDIPDPYRKRRKRP